MSGFTVVSLDPDIRVIFAVLNVVVSLAALAARAIDEAQCNALCPAAPADPGPVVFLLR